MRVEESLEVFPKGSAGRMRLHAVGAVGDAVLPRRSHELWALATPQPLQLLVLDGTAVPDRGTPGILTRLGIRAAEIATDARPAAMSTVKLELEAASASFCYAKVLALEPGSLTVRFTSVAPELEELFARLLSE